MWAVSSPASKPAVSRAQRRLTVCQQEEGDAKRRPNFEVEGESIILSRIKSQVSTVNVGSAQKKGGLSTLFSSQTGLAQCGYLAVLYTLGNTPEENRLQWRFSLGWLMGLDGRIREGGN